MLDALDIKLLVRSGIVGVRTGLICDLSESTTLEVVVWDVTTGLGIITVLLVVSRIGK